LPQVHGIRRMLGRRVRPAGASLKLARMDPKRAEELLRQERRRIERSLLGVAGADDGELPHQDQNLEHLADDATDLVQDELDEALEEQLQRELEAVERAERRLADGTYGLSVESGEPIPDERLEANPTAERTAEEQQGFERG
jgi:DnaK suppressor protein